jgi:hypothetical protein
MRRSEKLRRRLDELESRYSVMACSDLAEIIAGRGSVMLGGYDRRTETEMIRFTRDEIERLTKEISTIREKLGEPLTASPVRVVADYLRAWEELGVNQRPELKVSLAKSTLCRLQELSQS